MDFGKNVARIGEYAACNIEVLEAFCLVSLSLCLGLHCTLHTKNYRFEDCYKDNEKSIFMLFLKALWIICALKII